MHLSTLKIQSFFVISFLLCCLFSSNPTLKAAEINVLHCGANYDTTTIQTKAFQKAIDEVHASGGGRVLVPQGLFYIGTIELKSGVEFHLQMGAIVKGSSTIQDYPPYENPYRYWRGDEKHHQYSLFFAKEATNIAITGFGTIDGNGRSESFRISSENKPFRPVVLRFLYCENIRIQDVRMQYSASWMQHYHACKHLMIKGLQVFNFGNKNNDGLDIDGCSDVTVSDCIIDAEDDAICLKALSPEHDAENVVISNCILSSTCNVIKMGTETSGGFKKIAISNCVIKTPPIKGNLYQRQYALGGIVLEIVDGGAMDQISIQNIVMQGIATPIFIRLGNRARKYWPDATTPPVGTMKNIQISHVTAYTEAKRQESSVISGIPGAKIFNISLNDIHIHSRANALKMPPTEIPEKESHYPEAKMFGAIPAYGMYIRHAEQLTLSNVLFKTDSSDVRPTVFLEDVQKAFFVNVMDLNQDIHSPSLHVQNSQNINIENWKLNHPKKKKRIIIASTAVED